MPGCGDRISRRPAHTPENLRLPPPLAVQQLPPQANIRSGAWLYVADIAEFDQAETIATGTASMHDSVAAEDLECTPSQRVVVILVDRSFLNPPARGQEIVRSCLAQIAEGA
jgi:hypothetical protein